jgi:DNA-binding NtrC family response regulator
VILSDGETITVEDLPISVTRKPRRLRLAGDLSESERPRTLREIEMEVILQTLEKNAGDKPRTALELGIALKTLYNKLNQNQQHAEAG